MGPLPNEQPSEITSRQFGPDGQGLSGNSLESAIGYLGGNARTIGEESLRIRQQAAIAQRQAIIEWAEENGLRMDPSEWSGKSTIGGSEHDIWEEDGEYWKVTRPDRFGWTVIPGNLGLPEIAEATPLEYLERWVNANRILGDNAKLRGVAYTNEGVQVIIPSHSSVARILIKSTSMLR